MTIEVTDVVVPVIASIITVILAFFVQGFLSDRSSYQKLRAKLDSIAGKNATIVYTGAGNVGGTLYKIVEIGKEGIFIENPVHRIFLPISQVLQLPIILPVDDYKSLKEAHEKEEIERASNALFEPLFEKIEASIESNVAQPNSEISNSIEAKVIQILDEKGLLLEAPSKKGG